MKRFMLVALTISLLASPVLADGGYSEPASAGGCGILVLIGVLLVAGAIIYAATAKDRTKEE